MTDFKRIADEATDAIANAHARIKGQPKIDEGIAKIVVDNILDMAKTAAMVEILTRMQDTPKDPRLQTGENVRRMADGAVSGILCGVLVTWILKTYAVETPTDVEKEVRRFTSLFRDVMLLNLEEKIRVNSSPRKKKKPT